MRTALCSILFILWSLFQSGVVAGATHAIEQKFIDAGLIDVARVDPSIRVDLVNSDPAKNIFRENFYQGLNRAYLRRQVAEKLAKAQRILKRRYPDYSLQILDAARPRSVSKQMFEHMKGTRFERFVANPATGSMHNFGVAVDITIVDGDGNELDMGPTPFRKSTLEIYWHYALMKMGFDLSDVQRNNRKLLSDTMLRAGFQPLSHEWWHFNGIEKDTARRRFRIIE
ncbi:MAG: M15 family metallopeptidase [Candidatus Thiodiazotropha sp.]